MKKNHPHLLNAVRGYKNYFALVLLILLSNCKTTFKPMDVNGQGNFDYSLIPANPNWQYMLDNNNPPDATQLCPVQTDDPLKWNSSPTCTDQYIHFNELGSFNWGLQCGALEGHMNWFPVTYNCSIYWDQNVTNPEGEEDYCFSACRNDKALYTAGFSYIHTEFDADETIENWDNTNTWWENFQNADDDKSRVMVNGRYAIVIAMLGLDAGHADFKSELHPVYGMFIHTKDDPNDDRWVFFIRNWGNEGWCSSNQENLYRNTFCVVLPHENFDDVILDNQNVWASNNNNNILGWSYQKCKDGLLLSFTLDDPEKQGCIFGDVGLRWKGSNIAPRNDFNQNPLDLNLQLNKKDDPSIKFDNRISKLDTASKKKLFQLLNRKETSANFPLYPKPKLSRISSTPPHNDLNAIQNNIDKLKRNNKLLNYTNVRSVPDSSTFLRKKMRQDLILNFLKERGIE